MEWETATPPVAHNFDYEFLADDPYDIESLRYDPEIRGYVRRDPEAIRLVRAEAG